MKKRVYLLLASFLLLNTVSVRAQVQSVERFGRAIIDTLTTPYFYGRGYLKDGMRKASDYVAYRFGEMGLLKQGDSYFQNFDMSINKLHGLETETVNKVGKRTKMAVGADYIPSAGLATINNTYQLIFVDSKVLSKKRKLKSAIRRAGQNTLVLLDARGVKDSNFLKVFDKVRKNKFANEAGYVEVQNKLTYTARMNRDAFIQMSVLPDRITHKIKSLKITSNSEWDGAFEARNVIGMVKGETQPDSFIFLTAHYDHLGGIGAEAYFPGGNDNASGTAMLLALANYYSRSENQPNYSIVFIAFAAEEAGLAGSNFYTQHPTVNLAKIKFLLNMDMVGTGEDGITVVNATEFPKQFDLLYAINQEKNLLKEVKKRGTARNSDHYYFYENGVPSFFIYTLGGKYYHDIYDKSKEVPMTAFDNLFELIVEFIGKIN